MVFLWFSYEKWWFWRDELGMGMVDMTIVWIFIQFLEDLRSMESMAGFSKPRLMTREKWVEENQLCNEATSMMELWIVTVMALYQL
jgi:hypothetical protein